MLNYNDIIETLREGVVNLSFTKVKDDQVRDMKATLNFDMIPSDKVPKSEIDYSKESTAIRVFDMDLKDWRSFRVDKLITFNGKVVENA